jgi:hypothetical protein
LKQDLLSTPDFAKNNFYVKAYPNPVTDVVRFDVKNTDKNLKLRFYDINGHLTGNSIDVKAGQDISTTEIPVSHLNSGIYIYTLTENNKVIFKGKVIKK